MPNSTQCNQPDCDRGGKLTRGMCTKHYRYWLDHTPPEERGLPPRFARTFWEFVDKTNECWVWTGPTIRNGYGFWSGIGTDGRQGLAHRLSLAEVVPCPDETLFACHHCDNPPCVNPAHLYWGTVQDNARDRIERFGPTSQPHTHCKRGHEMVGDNIRIAGKEQTRLCRTCANARSRETQRRIRAAKPAKPRVVVLAGEAHGCARLTWEDVREMRRLSSGGATTRLLADQYGISMEHTRRILSGRAWKEAA